MIETKIKFDVLYIEATISSGQSDATFQTSALYTLYLDREWLLLVEAAASCLVLQAFPSLRREEPALLTLVLPAHALGQVDGLGW